LTKCAAHLANAHLIKALTINDHSNPNTNPNPNPNPNRNPISNPNPTLNLTSMKCNACMQIG